MGSSDNGLNCTADWAFEPNGDIVGIGVLVAFFVTATVTVGAILFGYFTESFPDSYLNDLDRYVIKHYQKSVVSRSISWLFTGLRALKDGLKSCLRFKVKPRRSLSREKREEALSRFILTLSDQQLVTGLATMVGVVANQRILSMYEFSVALSLAWFSSTTHLATLDALAQYFRKHGTVRNWRVGGMLSLLILLSYCLFLEMFAQTVLELPVPIQCYFSQQALFPANQGYFGTFYIMSIISTVLTLYILWGGYILRIGKLYDVSLAERAIISYAKLFLPKWFMLKNGIRPKHSELAAEMRSSKRLNSLRRIMKATTKSKWKAKLLSSSYQYDTSFLSSMSGVAFSLSYGISQVVAYRWLNQGVSINIPSTVDFGQITPIFLLVLPILVAAEIYYEFIGDDTEASSPHQQHKSSIEEKAPPNIVTTSVITDEAQKYKDLIPAMKEYLYRDIEKVRQQEASATTAPELDSVVLRKRQLLSDFEQYRAFEQNLDYSFAVIRVTFEVLISTVLGITLNVNSVQANVVAYFVFFVWCSLPIAGLYYDTLRYLMKTRKVISDQAAEESGGAIAAEKEVGGDEIQPEAISIALRDSSNVLEEHPSS